MGPEAQVWTGHWGPGARRGGQLQRGEAPVRPGRPRPLLQEMEARVSAAWFVHPELSGGKDTSPHHPIALQAFPTRQPLHTAQHWEEEELLGPVLQGRARPWAPAVRPPK